MIPDIPRQLDELGFPSKVENLQEQVNRILDEKASKEELVEQAAQTKAEIGEKFNVVDELEGV